MRHRSMWLLVAWVAGCGPGPIPRVAEIVPDTAIARAAPARELPGPQVSPADWPAWRGPQQDGVAAGPQPPTEWSDGSNVAWKVKLPGRGHSSPTVLGNRIYLETADEQTQVQSVLAVDRVRGKLLWQTDLFQGGFDRALHAENTQASSTIATDGERLFALFLNDNRIWCSALSLEGEELWRTEVGGFKSKQGYSASPIVYQSLVILAADHADGGYVAGLHRQTGDIVWRRNRPQKDSFASPRVVRIGGTDQVVISGCDQVAAYDPLTGRSLWTTPGTTESTVGTPVNTSDLVYVAGGYPDAGLLALRPDGSIAWQHREKVYVTSMLVHNGLLIAIKDEGIVLCWDAQSGRSKWKKRLEGEFRASPVASGDLIYALNMRGKTTVFRATPEAFELVAENTLGSEAFASPAISDGQLFLRVAETSRGNRQEYLYCIGTRTSERSASVR